MKNIEVINKALIMLLICYFSLISFAEEKTKIVLVCGAAGQELELNQEAARMYEEEHPNVEIEVWDTPNSTTERTELYLQFLENESSEIDIYHIDGVFVGDIADHLVDLNNYGVNEIAHKYFEANIKNNTLDGKLLALPWRIGAGLLYYRTDLLEKYSYSTPPRTWAELEEQAMTIQAGERKAGNSHFIGYLWQGDAYEGLTCNALEWIYSNGGGTLINKNREITVNNINFKTAIQRAKNWIDTISPESVLGMKEEDVRVIWENGDVAFMRHWPYPYSLSKKNTSFVKGKFDVIPLPMGDSGHGAATLGGWQLAVSKYSKNKEVAVDVLKFLTSEKVQKMRAVKGSLNPTIKSLYEDEEVLKNNEIFEKLYSVFLNAVPRPSSESAGKYLEVSKSFYEHVHDALKGKVSIEKMTLDFQKDLEEITGYTSIKQ